MRKTGLRKKTGFGRKTGFGAVIVLAVLWGVAPLRPTAVEAADLGVPSGTYQLDKTHAYIMLSYSHLGLSRPMVQFNDFDVDLTFNAEDPARSALNVTIDAASIDSGVEKFNEHLNSADFFETAAYPDITFKATDITVTGARTGAVTGDLTIKGVTRPVTLEVTLNQAVQHPMKNLPALGFSATGLVKRSAWGLDKFAPLVGDEVTLRIEAEFARSPDQ